MVTSKIVITTELDGKGKETINTAFPGDFIICGPEKEKHVVRFDKMAKLYDTHNPMILVVNQDVRSVACYLGNDGVFISDGTSKW